MEDNSDIAGAAALEDGYLPRLERFPFSIFLIFLRENQANSPLRGDFENALGGQTVADMRGEKAKSMKKEVSE